MADENLQPHAEKYRGILLIGPPGSGKGTQGRILGEVPGYRFVSMGEILRSLEAETQLGEEVQQHLRSGELVPAQLVISVWKTYMRDRSTSGSQSSADVVVLDGLPRNSEQAKLLQPHVRVERVIHLCCDNEPLLMDRIRRREAQRQDDANDNVIRHRLNVYREQTVPLMEWYPLELLAAVDAARSPLEVLGQIVSVLTSGQSVTPVESQRHHNVKTI